MSAKDGIDASLKWAVVGELSARMSHDANNLLAGVLGQAELGLLSRESTRMTTSLESIVKSAREMKVLMERLSAVSRLLEPGERSASIAQIFTSMYGLLERAFAKSGVSVEQRIGTVPTIWCEPESVGAGIMFVLRSALELCRSAGGGHLDLEVAVEQGKIVTRVRVTPPEGKSLETPTDTEDRHRASSPAALVRHHGGDLVVARDGRTVVLTCAFPERAATAAPAPFVPARGGERDEVPDPVPAPAAVASVRRSSRTLSALVVEDEPSVRRLLEEVLRGAGCRVESEANAESALRLFERSRHDLVLTDISMPGMDGLTLVRRLQEIEPRAVVVVITGRVTCDSVPAALGTGAKMVLAKPFELADIRAIVDSLHEDPTGESLKFPVRRLSGFRSTP